MKNGSNPSANDYCLKNSFRKKHTGRNPGFDRVLIEDLLLEDLLLEDVVLEDVVLEDVVRLLEDLYLKTFIRRRLLEDVY